MAYLTKAEFAAKCGLGSNNLSNYITRGKVILSGNMIDDELDCNKFFYEKRKHNGYELPPKKEKIKIEKKKTQKIKQDVVRISAKKEPEIREPDQHLISQSALEREKIQLENEKKRKEIEKLNIQIEKLHGILIPTDLAKSTVIQFSKSMSSAFKQAADSLIVEISSVKNLSSKETSKIRGTLITITNEAIERGLSESKKMIKNIVTEYSETRTIKGEHK